MIYFTYRYNTFFPMVGVFLKYLNVHFSVSLIYMNSKFGECQSCNMDKLSILYILIPKCYNVRRLKLNKFLHLKPSEFTRSFQL